ncbi:zinc finger protein ZAT3 [Cucumis sativus]|uniref:C2H2-type domain-containing protein n=1 Tax=Cucumis sativus TaxID=3659 RepID=A0A0A0KAW8_CUCSA|nr:zinc finger protein ZAT3 [Cucumis sativus]
MDLPLFSFNAQRSSTTTNSRRKPTKFIKTTTLNNASATPHNITPPCSECGKKFCSWKALFGHMRCHPERQWRGINPPPIFLHPPSAAQLDHEIATSLIMLSNAPPDPGRGTSEGREAVVVCEHKPRAHSGLLDLNLPPPMEEIEQESSSPYSSGIVLDLRLGLN